MSDTKVISGFLNELPVDELRTVAQRLCDERLRFEQQLSAANARIAVLEKATASECAKIVSRRWKDPLKSKDAAEAALTTILNLTIVGIISEISEEFGLGDKDAGTPQTPVKETT